ncbi:hypothetical protein, partial [Stenotrophomonas maltophilia group sp. RNC7]|uniref:hypothetical protein n=1 Tax=Stenotrophomonas maltophilia group sp. RNC7 TaxID=3071467 RepID=UPI0027E0E583
TDDALMEIRLGYTHYNKKLDIINVNNMAVTKIKNRNEGDKEKQHMLFKTYDDANKAVLVFEKIVQGVTCNNLEEELNEFIKKQFKKNDFELCIEPIPSKEFLEELSDMNKISILKV